MPSIFLTLIIIETKKNQNKRLFFEYKTCLDSLQRLSVITQMAGLDFKSDIFMNF